jgi:hypothetical protein
LPSAITEFPLPAEAGSLTVGSDGNLWFIELVQEGSPRASIFPLTAVAVGRITPAGAITEFPLPAGRGSSGGLTVGPDGNFWFDEESIDVRSPGEIGRITPAGAITQFPPPASSIGETATALTVGPDGDLWFTEGLSIGRLDPTPPRVMGAVAVAHSRKAITSILLSFDEALDPASASEVRFYSLASGVQRRHKLVFRKGVKIARVSYDAAANTVRLKLAVPQKGPVQVTVRAGLVAADGMSSFSDYTAVAM